VPQHDRIPGSPQSLKRRLWRIFRLLLLLSAVTAALAVVMVTRGQGEIHLSLIIATALGVGLTVLLGTSLMTLVFLSAESGHDAEAGQRTNREQDEQ